MKESKNLKFKLNNKQLILLNRINNNFLFKLFSISKLPLAFLTGLKIINLDNSECKTSVHLKYLNKNPFHSTYFAVLAMAAELSTGCIAMLATEGYKPSIAKIITSMNGEFFKKATGETIFICNEGLKIFNTVNKTILNKQPQEETINSIGYNKDGDVVAKFNFTWSFRQRD